MASILKLVNGGTSGLLLTKSKTEAMSLGKLPSVRKDVPDISRINASASLALSSEFSKVNDTV